VKLNPCTKSGGGQKPAWDDGTPRAEAIRVLDRYFGDDADARIALGFIADDILKALKTPPERDCGWQPVESPPKDGYYITSPEQPVFAWTKDRHDSRCFAFQLPPLPKSETHNREPSLACDKCGAVAVPMPDFNCPACDDPPRCGNAGACAKQGHRGGGG
jgi:hypothetical protein